MACSIAILLLASWVVSGRLLALSGLSEEKKLRGKHSTALTCDEAQLLFNCFLCERKEGCLRGREGTGRPQGLKWGASIFWAQISCPITAIQVLGLSLWVTDNEPARLLPNNCLAVAGTSTSHPSSRAEAPPPFAGSSRDTAGPS